jgi:hypothetical protein
MIKYMGGVPRGSKYYHPSCRGDEKMRPPEIADFISVSAAMFFSRVVPRAEMQEQKN